MSRTPRAQVALVLAGLAVGSFLYLARMVKASNGLQGAAAAPLIPQPATWQPFTATVTESSPLFQGLELFGDFARSSDGSERYDQATLDKRLHYVTIRNEKSGWQYACDMIQRICERSPLPKQPMVLVRVDTQYLRATSERIEGYELYRYTPPTGEVWLRAPALNFANLVKEDPRNGSRRVLSNIQRVEPDPALFDPPAQFRIVDRAPGVRRRR